MAYLLDSDWAIDHLSGEQQAVALLEVLAGQPIFISLITYMEVYEGALASDDVPKAISDLNAFLVDVPIVPLSIVEAQRCAALRRDLRIRGARPNRRALDLLIAATAIEHGLTLVTRNVDDFKDLPGLQLYGA
jgi:predicted nucleic acid-binding protein